MKTIPQIKKEIEEISNTLKTQELKKPEERKLRKKIPYLRTCILYLETTPSPSFLKQEIERIENKITLRMSGFVLEGVDQMPKSFALKARKNYEKQYDVPKLREQVRTMRFLLK